MDSEYYYYLRKLNILGSYSVGVAVQTVNLLVSASIGSTPILPIS